jgi:hypothetical protein
MDADTARARFQKIYARFSGEAPRVDLPGCRQVRRHGREIEVIVDGIECHAADAAARLKALSPEEVTAEALSLEEIFVTALQPEQRGAGAEAVA